MVRRGANRRRGSAWLLVSGALACSKEAAFPSDEDSPSGSDAAAASLPENATDGGDGANQCVDPLIPITAPPVELQSPDYVHRDPSGPHAVGTHYLYIEDPDREDPFTDAPDDKRIIRAQLFYPTDVTTGPYGPLCSDVEASALFTGLAPESVRFFHRRVETRSRFDVPLSDEEERWPVLFYSHGITGWSNENQELLEEFASHGWLVVALSHTYSTRALPMPDGSVALLSHDVPEPPPEGETTEYRLQYREALHRLTMDTWAPDLRLAMDEMDSIDIGKRCEFLTGRLDLDRMGVLGYSFGGSNAFEVCSRDARCKAAVNLDGGPHGEAPSPIDVPLMLFRDEIEWDAFVWDQIRDFDDAITYTVRLDGALHQSFHTMQATFETLFEIRQDQRPELDTERASEIVRSYSLAFMNEYVLGQDEALLGEASPYDEAHVERLSPGETPDTVAAFGALEIDEAAARLGGATLTMRHGDEEREHALDEQGRFRVSGFVPDEFVTLEFRHQAAFPMLKTFRASRFDEPFALLGALDVTELERRAASAGVALDEAQGQLLVRVSSYLRSRWLAPASEVSVAIAGASDVFYVDEDGELEASRGGTAPEVGEAMVWNLDPGEITVEFALAGADCRQETDPSAGANRVDTVVRAGTLTVLTVACE